MQQKIQDIRNSVSVDGKPLLDPKITFSDEEIESQISLLLEQNTISAPELKNIVTDLIIKIPDDFDIDKAVEQITEKLYEIVNWTGKQVNRNFWKNFSSAPFTHKGTTNKKLVDARANGAKGMDEIFGMKFHRGYSMIYELPQIIQKLKEKLEYKFKMRDLRNTVFSSPFKSVDHIEEETPVKRIEEVARIFYMDKTKPMKERKKAFSKWGKKNTWIHRPENPAMNKIFALYFEQDMIQRHEKVECESVIEWWLESLSENRCKADYSRNQYHPEVKETERNYEPSEKNIDRLENLYMDILFREGIGSFEYDW